MKPCHRVRTLHILFLRVQQVQTLQKESLFICPNISDSMKLCLLYLHRTMHVPGHNASSELFVKILGLALTLVSAVMTPQ